MFDEIKNIKSEKSDLRNFGIIVGIILLIISGFLFWKEKESYQIFLTVGTILFMLGILVPAILKPIYWIWMIFASILGWFMTRVILTLLFYAMLTPIGIISRFLGKQFIELVWKEKDSTYWNYRSPGIIEKERYKKQF